MRDCQKKEIKIGDRVVVIDSGQLGGQELVAGVITRMTKKSAWVLPDGAEFPIMCGKPKTRIAKL